MRHVINRWGQLLWMGRLTMHTGLRCESDSANLNYLYLSFSHSICYYIGTLKRQFLVWLTKQELIPLKRFWEKLQEILNFLRLFIINYSSIKLIVIKREERRQSKVTHTEFMLIHPILLTLSELLLRTKFKRMKYRRKGIFTFLRVEVIFKT